MSRVEALLVSEEFVKSVTAISDNLSGKYLRPAIVEAQDIKLRQIIGGALADKLKDLIVTDAFRGDFNNDFSEDFATLLNGGNLKYKSILNRARYYLAYTAAAELLLKVSYKVANMGVVRATDEHTESVSLSDINSVKADYINKADYHCKELQRWLYANRTLYPELTDTDCENIRACLYSAATSGLWLGGARGERRGR